MVYILTHYYTQADFYTFDEMTILGATGNLVHRGFHGLFIAKRLLWDIGDKLTRVTNHTSPSSKVFDESWFGGCLETGACLAAITKFGGVELLHGVVFKELC